MKRKMRKNNLTILLALLMSMIGAKAFAHDIEVMNADGVTIYYNYTNYQTELAVTHYGNSYTAPSYDTKYSESVVIPESVTYNGNTYKVTSIGDYAFYECSRLTEVVIPSSVTSIGNSVFSFCTRLAEVDIPNGVTSIGNHAFDFCQSLTSVTIPDNVTFIGDHIFDYCLNLTSVTIGNSVTSIGNSAFWGCVRLTSAIIPNSVTSIGDNAFYNCDSLVTVTIGNSVTSIGNHAFYGCESLASVIIPNSVTSIGDNAFHDCRSLTSVTLGNGVTSIGSFAFLCNSNNLTTLYSLNTTPPVIDYITFYSSHYEITNVYVPQEALAAYQNEFIWSMFQNLQSIGDDIGTGIVQILDNVETETVTVYTLGGIEYMMKKADLKLLPSGIYIVNGKKYVVK